MKIGRNKSSFSEHGVSIVKTRLYRLLRTLLTKNWPFYLQSVTEAINNSKNSGIGGLKPAQIKGPEDDPLVDKAIGYKLEVDVDTQKRNQRKYENDKRNIQVGSYVYVDFPPDSFEKSFDTKRNQLFIVNRIDAGKFPAIYKVEDLMGTIQPGWFYKEQLLPTSKPEANSFFKVEKIVKKRTRKGKKELFVKYLHYPAKFNQGSFIEWINRVDKFYYTLSCYYIPTCSMSLLLFYFSFPDWQI